MDRVVCGEGSGDGGVVYGVASGYISLEVLIITVDEMARRDGVVRKERRHPETRKKLMAMEINEYETGRKVMAG